MNHSMLIKISPSPNIRVLIFQEDINLCQTCTNCLDELKNPKKKKKKSLNAPVKATNYQIIEQIKKKQLNDKHSILQSEENHKIKPRFSIVLTERRAKESTLSLILSFPVLWSVAREKESQRKQSTAFSLAWATALKY